MIKLERPQCPPELAEHGERWSAQFARLRLRKPGARFRWARHQGRPVNHVLVPLLRAMTLGHCAYCDGFPVSPVSSDTIDHFRPKSTFPELSYGWGNLFYACGQCQAQKRERFDERLLAPDAGSYTFERYFLVNYRTGEIEPSPSASPADRSAAEVTIAMFGLNGADRPEARRRVLRQLGRLDPATRASEVDERPYRFLFDP